MTYDRKAEREAAFQAWWEIYGKPYEAAVVANDGTPWTADIEERRELWMRRYSRPAPPTGLVSDPRQPERCVAGAVRPRAKGPEGIESALQPSLSHSERLSSLPPIDDTRETAA